MKKGTKEPKVIKVYSSNITTSKRKTIKYEKHQNQQNKQLIELDLSWIKSLV